MRSAKRERRPHSQCSAKTPFELTVTDLNVGESEEQRCHAAKAIQKDEL